MNSRPAKIPILTSIAKLTGRYDAWLCDIWGVMHNGLTVFPSAADACLNFIGKGGKVVLISNAPRPWQSVQKQFDGFGVPHTIYHAIVTSGDVTRSLIRAQADMPVFHLGPARDRPIFEELDIRFASPEEAGIFVCTGLYDDTRESPADYEEQLSRLQARGLPMICANPDLMVERGSKLVYCAGSLAAAYEQLGGTVHYAGKPYLPIYEMALEKLAELRGEPLPRERVLAIGDGLRTDMAGAAAAGLDALFVASGLHVDGHKGADGLVEDAVARLFVDSETLPVAATARLSW